MTEKLTAGANIAAFCTKCKLGLDHAVVAMDGEAIAKVKCKTCGSVHKFKDPTPKVKKPRVSRKKEDALESLWESTLAGSRAKERIYDMSGKYRVGDIVLHNTFGKGIVRKLHVNKCDVLFKDKERLMASAN